MSGAGYEDTVAALTRADLAAWHRAWFHPNGSTLIVSGDTTLAEVVPLLERAFGGWPAGEAPEKNIAERETAAKGRVFLVDRPGAEQSVIVAVVGEELASIMRNMTLRLPGRFETLRALESAAVELVNYGYPPEYYYDYADNMRALTEQDLAAAAAEYVTPDELFWLVVGDLEKIEAGVRELAYGDVSRLDADGNPSE